MNNTLKVRLVFSGRSISDMRYLMSVEDSSTEPWGCVLNTI